MYVDYVDITVLVWQKVILEYGAKGVQGFLKRH